MGIRTPAVLSWNVDLGLLRVDCCRRINSPIRADADIQAGIGEINASTVFAVNDFFAIYVLAAMTFIPSRISAYVRSSRMRMWYLNKFLNVTNETLSGAGTFRLLRIQGLAGLIFALLGLYAWFR